VAGHTSDSQRRSAPKPSAPNVQVIDERALRLRATEFSTMQLHLFGTAPQMLKNGCNPHGYWVSAVSVLSQLLFLG
jgi:hypothetical protein